MSTKFIAEIGINHNGDIDVAKKLVDIAVICGCWAVKFQKRNPEACVPPDQRDVLRATPWGEMKYIDYRKRLEFCRSEYDAIDDYCRDKILWSASAWDIDSLHFMAQYDVKFLKVPSACLNDLVLISEIAKLCGDRGITLVASCGMSDMDEIVEYVNFVREFKLDKEQNVLMYCNSSYPTKNCDLNLRRIAKLYDMFTDFTIGYSDHAFGIIPCVTAMLLGAKYIEKHVTLDRTMWGTDQMCSLESEGLLKLTKYLREVDESLGSCDFSLTESQLQKKKQLRTK